MSDPEKSGAPTPAPADLPASAPAPAETAPASPAAAAAVSQTPAPGHPAEATANTGHSAEVSAKPATEGPVKVGQFGATRGSGLARGKRPHSATAAPSAPAPATGFKPSALEVITPQSEYKNPFTGETSVNTPRAHEPAPPPPPVPLPSAAASREVPAATPATSPVPESSASLDAAHHSAGSEPSGRTAQPNALPESSARPVPPAEASPKPELNILPPEGPRRTPLRWESAPTPESSAGGAGAQPAGQRRDERPTFQPRDRREGGREGRDPREAREPREGRSFDPRDAREPRDRRDERRFEPRTQQPHVERPEPPKKSGGLVGWFKGLFGGKKAEPAAPSDGGQRREGEQGDRGDRGGRGEHRGGRGRGGHGGGGGGYRGERGPREQGQYRGEGGPSHGGEPREGGGEHGDGQRRRRRRGGRGRYRGEGGGDRGGDRGPRPEGQQGGGAI